MSQITFFDGSNPFKLDKPIRLIELFAGIGAQAKALENLGVEFEHYRICEFDKYAVCSYNAIHGTNFEPSDITKIHAADLGISDTDKYCYIMTYSFPCTDLSKAGKQMGMARNSGTRSGLLWEVERLLDECVELPQVLIMENVPEVIGQQNASNFSEWSQKLSTLGYRNKYEVLNSKDFKIPQNRDRCFMVSVLGDNYFEFPESINQTMLLYNLLEPNVEERYFLPNSILKKFKMFNKTLNENGITVAGSLNPNKTCQDRVRVLDVRGIYQGLRATDYKDPPKIIEPFGCYSGTTEQFTREPICGLSRTLKAVQHDASVILPNGRIRKLTPKECWRLMGFDDLDFDRAKAALNKQFYKGADRSNSQLYKQAGNSIVTTVLKAIFEMMVT